MLLSMDDIVLSTTPIANPEVIEPCIHEDATHPAHMKSLGFESIMMRANDTDSLVLPIFTQAHLAFREF